MNSKMKILVHAVTASSLAEAAVIHLSAEVHVVSFYRSSKLFDYYTILYANVKLNPNPIPLIMSNCLI